MPHHLTIPRTCEYCSAPFLVERGLPPGKGRFCSKTCWYAGGRSTHGHIRGGKMTPEYQAWAQMKHRCFNQANRAFRNYGGRGITVCPVWRASFVAFLADMGPRPGPGYSLDRIENDGNYEPGNVRWATMKEQRANQRPRQLWSATP